MAMASEKSSAPSSPSSASTTSSKPWRSAALPLRQRRQHLSANSGSCRPPVQDALQRPDDRINIGGPRADGWFPFTGWNNPSSATSTQGSESIHFYTQQKTR